MRNIIRPRKLAPPAPEKINVVDQKFKFQKKVATKKQKRGPNGGVVYRLIDLEDNTEPEERDDVGTGQQVTFAEELCTVEGESDVTNDTDNDTTSNLKNSDSSNAELDTDDDKSVGEDYGVDDVEMSYEINDVYSQNDKELKSIGGSHVVQFIAHDWRFGNLYLKIKWDTDQTTWESVRDMRADHPAMTAQYIVAHNVTRSKRGGDRNLHWARKTVRDLDRAYKRLRRLYTFYLDEDDRIQVMRRTKKSKKKKKKQLSPTIKYGIKVPRNVKEAIEFDRENKNTLWQDAMKLEMGTLIDLECFEFKEKGYDPGEGWQKTTLHIVFDVKQDFRRKARLVAGGHLVDILDHQVYASTVKSISVQLLHMIAHKADLKQLCGDITNAFVTA